METMLPFIGMGVGVVALAAGALFARLRSVALRPAVPAATPPVRSAGLRPQAGTPAAPPVAAQRAAAPPARPQSTLDGLMPIVLSLLVLLSALYVVLFGAAYSDAQQKWAFGAIGTLLGYWLKK